MRPIAALILAAGHGRRMNSDLPKVLHEAAGAPLIEHVLGAVRDAGVGQRTVVTSSSNGSVASWLRARGVSAIVQKRRLGTAHAVMRAAKQFHSFRGDLVVLPADAPCVSARTLGQLIQVHRRSRAAATVLTARVSDPRGYGRLIRNRNGIVGIREELDASPLEREITEINSGVYVFDARTLFRDLARIERNREKKEYYLTDLIGALVSSKRSVQSYRVRNPEEVWGVNTRRELAGVHRTLNERELQRHSQAGVTILDPAQTVIAKGVRIGRDTVIHPFSWVERDVVIGRACRIGPFAKIRSGTRLKDNVVIGSFVEVVRSTIGSQTSAKHLSYLGDARIGRGVNVGAGTVTANFDGRKKQRSIVEDHASLGCHTVLVAPTVVGRRARTGAGAVVCAGQHVPQGKTVVGVPARLMERTKNRKSK